MGCEWLTPVKDIIVAFCAIGAASIAYKGLNTWQKELKGKSEYQLAKDVLKSVYKVQEAFKHVRHPAIMGYEYPSDMINNTGHLKDDSRYEGTAHVYTERWKKMDEAFAELEALHLDALVEWGNEHQDKIIELRKLRGELLAAIQDYLHRFKNPHEENWKNTDERKEEISVMYYSGGEHDKFTPKIEAAVSVFDDWLRPYISRDK
ncbi:hypothetical protein [Pseudoalteromonas luteoviolacea]|uniref:Uncharacterized protein n=1 Tax=Pseudoalteromonas luteoviolacea NCIMB 1942 TaxID=1365253 RepID=A0A166Z842_9GAMM|nr:hypothetical protein [Pseudoalteromonas luteoviolacea]KZN44037.1 hypothetical protein N482_17985 [Pseudoalteromonas luteoviolacea NCIMB 1942]